MGGVTGFVKKEFHMGTEFYSTNLAADTFLPKIVAGLLSHPKLQFYPSEINKHSCYLYYENSR